MDKVKVILTKYWVGILCGVIALVAIIASYIPLDSYHTELADQLKTSASTHGQLQSLTRQTRKLPQSFGQAEAEDLKQFPSSTIIASGEDLVKALDVQSKDAAKTVVDANRRRPLIDGVLPVQATPVSALNYRAAYIARLDSTLPTSLQKDVLKGTLPPTPEEIKKEGDRMWEMDFKPTLFYDAANNPVNKEPVEAQYKERLSKLPDEMRAQRARENQIYINDAAITMEPTVANKVVAAPTPELIWWSQMALWVQEDVALAISQANEIAQTRDGGTQRDVTRSAVKRLIKLDLTPGPGMLIMPSGRTLGGLAAGSIAGGAAEEVVAPLSTSEPIKLDPQVSPSGRVTTGMYDVIQFRLDMVVAAKELPMVLQTLSKNRLITVLNIETFMAEDAALANREGFIYGPEPVAHVVLRCEIVFLRDWTVPLMPDVIKKMLGAAPPQQAASAN